MGADFFFRMGSTHALCQDYAIAGDIDGYQYALLSDGCSGVSIPGQPGSPYTDFGARFLVTAARRSLDRLVGGLFPGLAITEDAAEMAMATGLPPLTTLDATLLAAVTTEQGNVVTFQTGDGVIAARRRDGGIYYRSLEFGSGMPFYMSYLLDERRLGALLCPVESGLNVSRERAEAAGTFVTTENARPAGGAWSEPVTVPGRIIAPPLDLARASKACVWTSDYLKADYDLVLVMSDGVNSFQTRDGQSVPLEQVLDQLFEFKGFVGQFLVRRCTRFQKFCADRGWHHADDFSVAGIYMG